MRSVQLQLGICGGTSQHFVLDRVKPRKLLSRWPSLFPVFRESGHAFPVAELIAVLSGDSLYSHSTGYH